MFEQPSESLKLTIVGAKHLTKPVGWLVSGALDCHRDTCKNILLRAFRWRTLIMLTPLLLAMGPVFLSPEFTLLVLAATLGAALILMVSRMLTGEQT